MEQLYEWAIIPPLKLTAYVNYKPVKNVFIKLYAIHTGSRDRFEVNSKGTYNEGEGRVKPVTLFNLNAGLNLKRFSYGLGIENLFNNTYYTVQSQLVVRDAEYTHGNGRLITLTLGYKF